MDVDHRRTLSWLFMHSAADSVCIVEVEWRVVCGVVGTGTEEPAG
jgi:hypothetical protein